MPADLDEDIRRLADLMSESDRCVAMTGVRLGATEDTEAKAAGSAWGEAASLEVLLASNRLLLDAATPAIDYLTQHQGQDGLNMAGVGRVHGVGRACRRYRSLRCVDHVRMKLGRTQLSTQAFFDFAQPGLRSLQPGFGVRKGSRRLARLRLRHCVASQILRGAQRQQRCTVVFHAQPFFG